MTIINIDNKASIIYRAIRYELQLIRSIANSIRPIKSTLTVLIYILQC